MSKWIECENKTLLNMDNVIVLKVQRTSCKVQAECVGNRTVDISHCADREEAYRVCRELAEIPEPKKKKPAAKK